MKKSVDIEERFWSNVQKGEDCWLWTASYDRHGYGKFGVFANGKKCVKRAHRAAWGFTYGAIPKGMLVLHSCDNPLCVRPEHLKLGTHAENTRDMMERGRFQYRGNQYRDEFGRVRG